MNPAQQHHRRPRALPQLAAGLALSAGLLLLPDAQAAGRVAADRKAPALAGIVTRCTAEGGPPATGGSTPPTLPGTTTVSARTADCMIRALGDRLVVVSAMKDKTGIAGSWPVPYLQADLAPEMNEKLVAWMLKLSGGRKDTPLLVYCHHTSCGYSQHALEWLHARGFTQLFWMREGLKGWREAALPERRVHTSALTALHLYLQKSTPVQAITSPVPAATTLPADYLAAVRSESCTPRPDPGIYGKHLRDNVLRGEAPAKDWDTLVRDKSGKFGGQCWEKIESLPPDARPATTTGFLIDHLIRLDARLEAAFQEARTSAEQDPGRHFPPPYSADDLVQATTDAASPRSLRSQCGDFNFNSMPTGSSATALNASLARLRERRDEYVLCVSEFIEEQPSMSDAVEKFEKTMRWLDAVRQLPCAQRATNSCMNTGVLPIIAAIATPQELEQVKRAEKIYDENEEEASAIEDKLSAWHDRINAFIEARNERVRAQDEEREASRRYNYSQPQQDYESDSSPATPYPRRGYDSSAPGMR